MKNLPPINIQDYNYDLPEQSIANYPLERRDQSKLLKYHEGKITHSDFSQLPDLLPDKAILFFNNTKVIPARLLFEKDTGASIEVFLLQPIQPSVLLSVNLQSKEPVTWKCAIGNLKKWNENLVLTRKTDTIILNARLKERDQNLVEFSWQPSSVSFAEVVQHIGAIPLPPYIKRKDEASDKERYQTVYSKMEGAVAAPTAGLHFTDEVLAALKSRGYATDFLTLHVSAGTFMPVKAENALDHNMHDEQIILTRQNIENLLKGNRKVIAVGTTALRTLESLYWHGVRLISNPAAPFVVEKLQPYQTDGELPSLEKSLEAVLIYMDQHKTDTITGQTSIFIFPGYIFRLTDGLITNFHQPSSTLLLLVAALIGSDWKKVYQEAISKKYRFLSYGDSSLLLRS
ncbi:MAG: S-adenosylmethionine:tRNA ribosyltransferase-isomerase [Cyclobacteriaceae bacterium]|nr:S-adenosylmethionine:tRNA ribosyltransferase-isomerase [Cyclobacteriaceae bacterium]